MIVFNGYFGSYTQRQLVADHINYNKDVFVITLKEILSNTLKN